MKLILICVFFLINMLAKISKRLNKKQKIIFSESKTIKYHKISKFFLCQQIFLIKIMTDRLIIRISKWALPTNI